MITCPTTKIIISSLFICRLKITGITKYAVFGVKHALRVKFAYITYAGRSCYLYEESLSKFRCRIKIYKRFFLEYLRGLLTRSQSAFMLMTSPSAFLGLACGSSSGTPTGSNAAMNFSLP